MVSNNRNILNNAKEALQSVRKLEAGDIEIFKKLRLEALRAEPENYASSLQDYEDLSQDEWLSRLNGISVFAIFRDGDPVGIMGLLPQILQKKAHTATLVMVYLRKTERASGAASHLLQNIVNFACLQKIQQLELTVSAENPAAIGFYEKEGFLEVGRIPGAMLDKGRKIDEIIMVRRLGESL